MKRVLSLDATKGLLIILMTISHIGISTIPLVERVNLTWLFLFKMPGFYIISGYLMYNSLKNRRFVFKKLDGILKPYLAIVLFIIMPTALFYGVPVSWHDILNSLTGKAYTFGNGFLNFGSAWFIINLTFSFVISKILFTFFQNKRLFPFLFIIALIVIVNRKNTVCEQKIIFHANMTLFAVLYLFTGYFIRHINLDVENKWNGVVFASIYLLLKISLGNNSLNINLACNVYDNFFAIYPASICGTLAIISLISLLKNNPLSRLLALVGRHSLFILIVHVPLWTVLTRNLHNLTHLQLLLLHALTITLCVLLSVVLKRIDCYGLFFKPLNLPMQKTASDSSPSS